MLPNWNDLQVAENHRRDLLADAARDRLAAEAELARMGQELDKPAARAVLYARILARLGRLMVNWGDRLQRLDPTP